MHKMLYTVLISALNKGEWSVACCKRTTTCIKKDIQITIRKGKARQTWSKRNCLAPWEDCRKQCFQKLTHLFVFLLIGHIRGCVAQSIQCLLKALSGCMCWDHIFMDHFSNCKNVTVKITSHNFTKSLSVSWSAVIKMSLNKDDARNFHRLSF